MSEKKEPVRIGLGTLFLILIIFILATIILVMFLENKNIISINLKQNANETISENKVANEEKFNEEENEFEKIILEGNYGPENSDFGYHFYKDGTVEIHGNIDLTEGTYYTVEKNQIEMKFTKITTYDDEGNASVKNINRIEKCIVKDKYTLTIEYEINGEKIEYDIVKFGEDSVEQEKIVCERLEENYSNVVYRRETESSAGHYIENGLVYTEPGNLTQGIVGKPKYAIPLNKQFGTSIVLTEEGMVYGPKGERVLDKFEKIELGYRSYKFT